MKKARVHKMATIVRVDMQISIREVGFIELGNTTRHLRKNKLDKLKAKT